MAIVIDTTLPYKQAQRMLDDLEKTWRSRIHGTTIERTRVSVALEGRLVVWMEEEK